MKLNFWQIVGGLCVVVALVLIIKREMSGKAEPTAPTTAPSMTAR